MQNPVKIIWARTVPLSSRHKLARLRNRIKYSTWFCLPSCSSLLDFYKFTTPKGVVLTNKIGYAIQRRMLEDVIHRLEKYKRKGLWGKVSSFIAMHALVFFTRILYTANKINPDLFAKVKNEPPIPLSWHWIHHVAAYLRFSSAGRAQHYEKISSRFFAYGHPNQALIFARLARDLQPNSERHDAVLRCLLTARDTQQEFYDESKKWSELYEKDFTDYPLELLNLNSNRPLRVGLLCDYLNSVIGRFTLQPQIRNHRNHNVVFFVYNFGDNAYLSRKICPRLRNVRDMSDDEVHEWIRQDGIDILIEMNGRLRPSHKFSVLTKHPAPIQVSWYNLPATSGLKSVNYVITDEYALPKGQDKFFTEKVIRLKGGATGGWDLPQYPVVKPLPAQRGNGVTFGCFGDMFKYNNQLLDVWCEILHAVPNSRLYLKNAQLDLPLLKAYIVRNMAKRGIYPDRLILGGMSPYEHMRELYSEIDIALDTFPFSSGSTSINALWQGVPVLCIAGPDWRGRSTASIMANADLTDFIASDTCDYIGKAISMANDLDYLSEIRSNMRERLSQKSTYFNIDRYVTSFESGLKEMWEDYLKRNKVNSNKVEH